MGWSETSRFFKSRKGLSGDEILSILAMSFLISLLAACVESVWCIDSDWALESKRAMLWQLFNPETSVLIVEVFALETVFSFLVLMLFGWMSRFLRWPIFVILLSLWAGNNVCTNFAPVKAQAAIPNAIVPGASQADWS